MKRYFYTDPLAAAWMAKHFEMRILDAKGDEIPRDWVKANPSSWMDPPYNIHPDSLSLLEPQAGDLILTIHSGKPRVPDYTFVGFACLIGDGTVVNGVDTTSTDRYYYVGYKTSIIQRNGLAYHMPESEDA